MESSYRVAFDLARSGFQEWDFLLGLGGAVVSACLLVTARRAGPGPWTKAQFGYLAASAILALWTVVGFGFPFVEYLFLRHAYDTGDYKIVTGTVDDFASRPDGKGEHFTVSGIPFSYTQYDGTSRFHCTESAGGPIRAGLPVRIAYTYDGNFLTNAIIRLEILSRSPIPDGCAPI